MTEALQAEGFVNERFDKIKEEVIKPYATKMDELARRCESVFETVNTRLGAIKDVVIDNAANGGKRSSSLHARQASFGNVNQPAGELKRSNSILNKLQVDGTGRSNSSQRKTIQNGNLLKLDMMASEPNKAFGNRKDSERISRHADNLSQGSKWSRRRSSRNGSQMSMKKKRPQYKTTTLTNFFDQLNEE